MTGRVATSSVHVASDPTYDEIPGVFEPGQQVTERPRPELVHRISINSLGFRGDPLTFEKAPGQIRILCLGDSFTFGSFVNDEDTFPSLLGTALRRRGMPVEVINGGVGGTTIVDQAHFLSKALVLKPDLVLLTFSENDIDDLNKTVPLHVSMAENRRWKSGIAGWIYLAVRDTALFNFLLFAKARYADLGTPRALASGPSGVVVESDALWQRYEAELEEVANALRSHSIGFVFVVFPSDHRLGRTVELGNRLQRAAQLAERHGVPVVDLLAPLQATGLSAKDLYLLPYDGHPSPRGYGVVADTISSYLVGHRVLEGASARQPASQGRPSP
jgi:lysophospholipase L1-like esterase